MSMLIRRLVPADAGAFQALRLAALRESASAFSSSYDEECDTPPAAIAARLEADSGRHLFGAFDGAELAGVVGVGREEAPKLRHKATIRGMVVAPAHRGKGVGKLLLEQALAFIAAMPGLRQVSLVVTADNAAAIGMYQAKGFKVFGQEPDALCVDGVFHDNVHMARLMKAG